MVQLPRPHKLFKHNYLKWEILSLLDFTNITNQNTIHNSSFPYEDDGEAEEEAADGACGWESMMSMSSSSFTPHVSTTLMRQLVTGNALTLLQVTHLRTKRKMLGVNPDSSVQTNGYVKIICSATQKMFGSTCLKVLNHSITQLKITSKND